MQKLLFIFLMFGVVMTSTACSSDSPIPEEPGTTPGGEGEEADIDLSTIQFSIQIGETVFYADPVDHATTKDFVSMLPLTLSMGDIRNREKLGYLSRSLAEGGTVQTTYEVGDMSYWPNGPGLAVFYNHDGREVASGLVSLGKIVSGIENFNVTGSVEVTIDVVEKTN